MNNLGKFLVTTIMVMSVMFCCFSIALRVNHKDWKAILEREQPGANGEPKGLIAQINDANQQVKSMEEKLDILDKEAQEEELKRQERLAAQAKAFADFKAKRDDKAKQLEDLEKDRREKTTQLHTAMENLKNTLDADKKLRGDIAAAIEDRNQTLDRVETATDLLNQLIVELGRVKDAALELGRQLAVARAALNENDLSPDTSLAGVPPTVDGIVLESRENGYVEISLGKDDGVEVGHTFLVYRRRDGQNKPLGKIEVVRTLDDKSVAKVLPEFNKAPIEKEDRVATRL